MYLKSSSFALIIFLSLSVNVGTLFPSINQLLSVRGPGKNPPVCSTLTSSATLSFPVSPFNVLRGGIFSNFKFFSFRENFCGRSFKMSSSFEIEFAAFLPRSLNSVDNRHRWVRKRTSSTANFDCHISKSLSNASRFSRSRVSPNRWIELMYLSSGTRVIVSMSLSRCFHGNWVLGDKNIDSWTNANFQDIGSFIIEVFIKNVEEFLPVNSRFQNISMKYILSPRLWKKSLLINCSEYLELLNLDKENAIVNIFHRWNSQRHKISGDLCHFLLHLLNSVIRQSSCLFTSKWRFLQV